MAGFKSSIGNRPVNEGYPYVYLDGLYLKRSWGGEVRNIAVLVAVGVDKLGFREILGISEGVREDKESWRNFLRHLKQRGLDGVELIISDKCLGLVESIAEFYPDARWQWCFVHFERNVFTAVPNKLVREVALMLKGIYAQDSRQEALANRRTFKRCTRTREHKAKDQIMKQNIKMCARILTQP